MTLGAIYLGDNRCRFLVWAPRARRVELVLLSGGRRELVAMRRQAGGYHQAVVEGVKPGARYLYRLEGRRELPDPASRSQPDGVHGASEVVEPRFAGRDAGWAGVPLHAYVLYELHVGTFTPEGTLDAAIRHLPRLRKLGVAAIELMPVAQFPGSRNWGYDGVYPFAVQDSYGGPTGLKRLVNAAHRAGLAIVLDVVYNHLGSEGNHLGEFGPCFLDSTHTPWGPALNFAGPSNREVRRFFIENALYWQTEFHIDALRLDAVHAIHDSTTPPFLGKLAAACHRRAKALGRPFYLVAEGGLDIIRHRPAVAAPRTGLDAEWRDDFHHCLHVLLTGEQTGYYARFGGVARFARVWRAGLPATDDGPDDGRHSQRAVKETGRTPSFVVFSQNHDQAGNRPRGERLAVLASFEAQKLAAATVLLSPFIPLLFMGEEYGETAPFLYFVSHSEPALIQAVSDERRAELATFGWRGEPLDPQDPASYESSRLDWGLLKLHRHRLLREFYRELIGLRGALRISATPSHGAMSVYAYQEQETLLAQRMTGAGHLAVVFNYSSRVARMRAPLLPGLWLKRLDSASRRWGGPGSRVPNELRSSGRVILDLPATSVLAFELMPPQSVSAPGPPARRFGRRN